MNKVDATIVVKAAVRKSILMQITKARAVNGFLQTKTQDYHINVNNFLNSPNWCS
ncbi:MAG: hypothetical protein ACJ72X_16000 [Nitrososphaeraceae archaeon]